MRAAEAMIAWTPARTIRGPFSPTAGAVIVVPWPDRARMAHGYAKTAGACSADFHALDEDDQLQWLLAHLDTMVIRDLVRLSVAHRAMLRIDEYRSFSETTRNPRRAA